jgi:hypothetical protein
MRLRKPARVVDAKDRRLVAWDDLEVRQAGRGIRVRARAPWFSDWWNDGTTWEGDLMGPMFAWLDEERG